MSKQIINVLILSVFIVVVWMATELYFLSKKDLSLDLDKKLTPEKANVFDPTLDMKTVEALKQNQINASHSAAELPSPTATPTPPRLTGSTRSTTPTP